MLAFASASLAFAPLSGISLPRASDASATVDLGALSGAKTLVVFGTYPADFNMIEYAQRVRFFMPQLREKGVDRYLMVVNAEAPACQTLARLLDLPDEIELLCDPTGEAGRRFGVSRGFMPDAELSPFLKLFVVGIGLGPPWGS